MVDRSKALVTRAALERVLARATELQGASGDETGRADTLTEAQVEELGNEVGLSPAHIRQALAEERARIQPLSTSGTGFGYELFGANQVATQRLVRGKPATLLDILDRWMKKEEWLRVVRQRADFIVWEPGRSVLGTLSRFLGNRDYALYRSDSITATVVPVDDEFTLVRLDASFARLRRGMASQTAVATTIGAASTGAALLMGIMAPVAVVPVIGFAGASLYFSRQTQQHAIQRAHLALEQVLDRLERGDAHTPSLLRMIESALPPSR